jgi:hypothetical protein
VSWYERAREAITHVHASLPDDAPLKERQKAVDAAYPFGSREYWPYKGWLKARRQYLCRYGYVPRGHPKEPPPLFANLPRDPETGRPVI